MAEREMNKHQRGMIDGCFEEGHYQRGIASLNQLRMQNLRPSPAHIRQLIYISLYPPPPPKKSSVDKGKRKEGTFASGSPSKQIQQAKRLQKQALLPPPEATEAAKEILYQFAIDSISPEALLRSVPSYPLAQAELDAAPRPIEADMFSGSAEFADDMDSYVAKQADKLRGCKDCWALLRDGVVERQDVASVRRDDPFFDADPEEETDDDDSSPTIIGKHSWHLLEWLILLFEKDQDLARHSANAVEDSYSVLLLSQIKPASRTGEPRSYIDSVLEVMFLCHDQTEPWRRNLGKRLMTLLVSLTRCNGFSPLQLFTTLSVRLQASPRSIVVAFLSDLPVSPLGLTFKQVICDRFLTQSLRDAASANGDGMIRARPQARKARPISAHANGDADSSTRSRGLLRDQNIYSHWNVPSLQRILQLLELSPSVRSNAYGPLPNLDVLFHFIAAIGICKAEEGTDADRSWVDAVLTGELERRIGDMYADEGLSESDRKVVRPMRLLLLSKCASWKQLFIRLR